MGAEGACGIWGWVTAGPWWSAGGRVEGDKPGDDIWKGAASGYTVSGFAWHHVLAYQCYQESREFQHFWLRADCFVCSNWRAICRKKIVVIVMA